MSGCQRFRMRWEKEVDMVVKGNTKIMILFYPDCSGGYMSLHVRKSCRK